MSSAHKRLFPLLPLFLAAVLPPTATPISFNYTRFDRDVVTSSSNPSGGCPEGIRQICLKEDAAVVAGSASLELTYRQMGCGYAVYSEALPVWRRDGATGEVELTNFTSTFFVNFTKTENNCTPKFEDGMAFFLSAYPHRIPPDSDDGMMGLVDKNNMFDASGDGRFLAVEVDTHINEFWDPPYMHLGIDVNSIRSVVLQNLTDLAGGTLNVIGEVVVEYSSVTRNLTVTMSRGGRVYARLTHNVDLSLVLPQLVAVGLSATTFYCTEYYRINSWTLNSTWDPPLAGGRKRTNALVIWVPVGIGLLGVVALAAWLVLRRRRADDQEEGVDDISLINELDGGPQMLQFHDLVIATDNFDEKRKLGVGGSGAVYRATLTDPNREVAIKRVLNHGSRQARRGFIAEFKIISQLHHRHLVQLVGWCQQRGEFLLAYELMPNLSLDQHLFSPDKSLPWATRYDIALGVASALLYLHEEGVGCVLHRDVKSSNVMLDAAFKAKLGDFGLARLTEHGRGVQNSLPGGTIGYMAPECFHTRTASTQTDVYAFGIVLLEIASGRRAIEADVRLVQWVWDFFSRDAVLEAADRKLGLDFDRGKMERLMVVGLWCAHPDARCRPSIRKALAALNFEVARIDIPRQMPVTVYTVAAPPVRGGFSREPSGNELDPNISLPSTYFHGR